MGPLHGYTLDFDIGGIDLAKPITDVINVPRNKTTSHPDTPCATGITK